jgi:SulP family sulfate permease
MLADTSTAPLEWFCLDLAATSDIDYSGGETLTQMCGELHDYGVRLVLSEAMPDVRAELDRYGITELMGADAYFPTVAAAMAAFAIRPAQPLP